MPVMHEKLPFRHSLRKQGEQPARVTTETVLLPLGPVQKGLVEQNMATVGTPSAAAR